MIRKVSYLIFSLFLFLSSTLFLYAQNTTVRFDELNGRPTSGAINVGSKTYSSGGLVFEIIPGTNPGVAVSPSDNGPSTGSGGNTYGIDDNNTIVPGGVIGWKITKQGGGSFQFVSAFLLNGDPAASQTGTIKAFSGGSQVGGTYNANFSGVINFAGLNQFWNVEEVRIEASDIFLVIDDVTFGPAINPVDEDPPLVTGISLVGTPLSTVTSVNYTVSFSKLAKNVSSDDFQVTTSGTSGTVGAVSGSGSSYTVTVNGIGGEGTIRLDLKSGTNIANADDITGTPAFTSGQLHFVGSCFVETFETETDASTTFSGNGVNFSLGTGFEIEKRTGFGAGNTNGFIQNNITAGSFSLSSATEFTMKTVDLFLSDQTNGDNPTGTGSITITGKKGGVDQYSITKNSNFPTNTTVNGGFFTIDFSTDGAANYRNTNVDELVFTISGGFIELLVDNLNFCEAVPFVDTQAPVVQSISKIGNPLSTAGTVNFQVTFDEAASNVSLNDFTLLKTGTATGSITGISGSGSGYTLSVTGITGEGSIQIKLNSGTDIADALGNTPPFEFLNGEIHLVGACYIETFETFVNGATSFTSNGKAITLGGNWAVKDRNGFGINSSDVYIENTGIGPFSMSVDIPVKFSKLAFFLTSNTGTNPLPSNNGTLTIRGKNGASTEYEITKDSGFPTDFSSNSGYFYIDFATEGGADNSNTYVDGLEIEIGGSFIYLALENMEFCSDFDAPTGYTATIDQSPINRVNDDLVSFTFADAEIGTTYNYTFTSSGGAGSVTNSGVIATATDQITAIDLTGLPDGTITLSVTLTDLSGNTGGAATDTETKETVAPTGYSVQIDQDPITPDNDDAVSFTFAGAEVGSTYNYTFTSSGGAGSVTNSGVIVTATDQIFGIDLSGLPDGTITLSVTLTDTNGNVGSAATDTSTKEPSVLIPLTITGITGDNKLYDGTTAATASGVPVLTGLEVGDDVVLGGSPVFTFVTPNVGNGITITTTGYTLSGTDAGKYTLTQPTLSAGITAKTLTISGISANNKVYDGTPAASASGVVTLSGIIGADDVNAGGSPIFTFASQDVGTGITVNTTGFTISGTNAGNYTLIQPTLLADITTKTLTISGLNGDNKVYDGTTSATASDTPLLLGIVGADDVSLEGVPVFTFVSSNVDTGVTITTAGFTLGGTDAGNYTLTQPDLSADITARTLTIIGLTGDDKVFDGTTAATASGTPVLAGVIGADDMSLGGVPVFTFASSNVGTGITIITTGYTISGTDSGNYSLTQPTLSADITASIPLITEVKVPNPGTYNFSLFFDVVFSEEVNLDISGGLPALSLNIGGQIRQTDEIFSGTIANSYRFRYNIRSTDLDLDGIEVIGFNLNGGTVKSTSSGTDADLTLNNVGNTSAVLVDGIGPTGYAVSIDLLGESFINVLNQNIIEFSGNGLEVGATLNYSFTSDGGGTPVNGTETVTSTSQQFDNAGAGYDLSGLADGTVTLTVSLTDAVGNTGADVTDMKSKDSTAPIKPGTPDLLASSDSGISDSDNITNDRTPTLQGTADPNITIEIISSIDGSLGETTSDNVGVWVFTPTELSPTPGRIAVSHDFTARAKDGSGNFSDSDPLTVVIDAKAPAPVAINGIVLELGQNGMVILLPEDLLASPITDDFSDPVNIRLEVSKGSFDCGDVGIQVVRLIGTDEAGNSDYAETSVFIQDTLFPCPTLTIAATTQAAEDNTNGVFTVSTSRQFTTNTNVSFTVSGTATAGTDYTNLGTSFIFPANTNSVTITVPVIGDGLDENDEEVTLTLTGTDNAAVTVGTPSQATLTITDDDETPVVVAGQVLSVDENTANGTTIGTLLATDTDAGTTFGDWTITSGNIGGVFSINPTSGELSIADNTNLDSENTAQFTLSVTVSDGTNTSDRGNFVINVTDVNDVVPVISQNQVFAVKAGDSNGTSLGTVLATDGDVTPTNFQNWTITAGNVSNDGDAETPFAIDPTTGEISINDTDDINTGNLDYSLTITVSDGVNTSAPETVQITGSQLILNVTANAGQNKVFGEADPAFTFTATGFEGGDTEAIFTGSLERAAGEDVDLYSIGLGTLDAGNKYVINYDSDNFEITPATITGLTFADGTFVYDGTQKSLGSAIGTFPQNASDSYVNNERTVVGTQEVTATISAPNYTTLELKANLTITPAPLQVTALPQSKVYGSMLTMDTDQVSYSGFVNAEDETVLVGTLILNSVSGIDASTTAAVGTYVDEIEPSGLTADNYEITYVNGDLAVTRTSLTVTALSQSKAFGSSLTLDTDKVTLTGFVNAEDETALGGSLILNSVSGIDASTTAAVGTYVDEIEPSGLTSDNYEINFINGDLVVAPAALAGITFEDENFVYDGAAKSLAISGTLPAGAAVAYTNNSRTDVGTQEVTATISGSNFTTLELKADLTITPAPLQVTALTQSKVYGSMLTLDTDQVSYSGFVNAEDETVLVGTLILNSVSGIDASSTAAVGTYVDEIVPSGLTSDNYEITYVNGDLAVTRTSLTVTALSQSKAFGSSLTLDTDKVTLTGFVNAEDETALGGSLILNSVSGIDASTTAAVGTYVDEIEPSGLTSDNYEINFINGDLVVAPAALAGITFEDENFVYDGAAKSLGISGTLPAGATVTYTNNSRTDVGTQEVTATISGSNFTTLELKADLTITPATVSGIIFEDASFVFDGAAKSLAITGTLPTGTSVDYINNSRTDVGTQEVTATISGSNFTTLELKADLTITPAVLTGISFEDDSFVFDGAAKSLAISGTLPAGATVTYTNNSRTDVGTQEVTATISGSNFTTLELKADLTITPATLAGITFEDDSFVFDGAAKSLAITGTLPTGTSVDYTNNSRTNVGIQEVTATISGSNYTTLELKADLTIVPATITGVTISDASFTYDGTAKSLAITGTIPLGTAVAYSNNSRTDVGTQEVTATISGVNFTEVSLMADLSITPATLMVMADEGQSKEFGMIDPELTYAVSGLQGSDTEAILTGTLTREAGEDVGSYAINQGSLSGGMNYTIDFTGADFMITEVPNIDNDGDGVPDKVEEEQGTDPGDPMDYQDEDGDDVPDYVEEEQGTDPTDPGDYVDTDGDNVPDYVEEQQGTDPNDSEDFPDEDENGLPDYVQERAITEFVTQSLDALWGTEAVDLKVPTEVVMITEQGEFINLVVIWNLTGYDPLMSGTTSYIGIVDLPAGLFNPNELQPTLEITVQPKPAPQDVSLSANSFIAIPDQFFQSIGNFTVVDPSDNIHILSLPEEMQDNNFFEVIDGILFWSSAEQAQGRTEFTISLRVTDRAGNVLEKNFQITRNRTPLDQLDVPNTFTPNNDGANDAWGVPALRYYQGVRISIMDIGGNRVFYTENPDIRWDGTFDGKEMPVGAYFWIIEVAETGEVRRGVLNLLRQ